MSFGTWGFKSPFAHQLIIIVLSRILVARSHSTAKRLIDLARERRFAPITAAGTGPRQGESVSQWVRAAFALTHHFPSGDIVSTRSLR